MEGVLMSFIKKTTDIDFGQTSIENIFINDFMPMADGTYVKVYLLGYKYATDRDENIMVDNNTIAKHLNIPLVDVLKAWEFWEKVGIVKKHIKDTDDSNDFLVEFLSLRQLYIDNNYELKNASKSSDDGDRRFSDTTTVEELLSANKVPEIKNMFYDIQQLIRRRLYTNDMQKILDWIKDFNMDPDVIVRAFQYSVERRNVKKIGYVGAIIRSWYDDGIISIDKVEEYFEKTDTRFAMYIKILKSLGIRSNPINEHSKKIMDKWIDTWGFSLDVILKACENSIKISNPNLKYIDKILEDWKENGVKTIEDAEKRSQERNKEQKENKETKVIKKFGGSKNKFNDFEQRATKYSNEELEKILGLRK